ncbi:MULTISPECIES: hypothetical protein [Oceanobacillus]|nr:MULTISPECIES: hypothetical protein [Oceanobacillus]
MATNGEALEIPRNGAVLSCDLSREKFEEYIGEEVANWPEDIY